MFYQIFLSPQVKRCVIITYMHGMYELRDKLRNDFRPKKIGSFRKVSNPHRMKGQRPAPLQT